MLFAKRILQYSVAAQCFGVAWRLGWTGDSPLFSLLWHAPSLGGLGLSEGVSHIVEQTVAVGALTAGAMLLLRPFRLGIAFLAVVQAMLVLTMWWTVEGYQPLPGVVPLRVAALFPFLTQAARVGAPVGLLLLLSGRDAAAMATVRLAIALTFFAHGLEALLHNPHFIGMLLTASERLLHWQMPQDIAEALLYGIGAGDILLATLCLARKWQTVLWYMAAWGLITAAARLIVMPAEYGIPEFLVRIPHATLPAWLALYYREHPT